MNRSAQSPIAPTSKWLALLPLFVGLTCAVTAQCTLVCNQGIQVSLNPAGQAVITTQLISPNAPNSCPGALDLTLFNNVGQQIPNPLTCNNIGQTITARVRHLASGNFCTGNIEVIDALSPTVTCSDKFIFCNQNSEPSEVGIPVTSDNCTPSNALLLNYFDTETTLGCGVLQNGLPVLKRIDRAWTVTDEHGNSSNCVQKIWLKHIRPSDLSYPANRDNIGAPALACGADPTDLGLTGEPTVAGMPVENSIDCEIGIAHTDQIINNCPPASFTVLRTWTIVDFCAGAVSSRIQIIKVEDKVAPVITPPANLTLGTDGFTCSGSTTLPQANATDNCSAVTIVPNWVYGTGYGPYTNIPLGDHIVTYTATDGCNNISTATMVITVADTSPPQAICSSSLQVSLSAGGAALLNAGTIGVNSSDNCGPVFLTASRDAGDYLPQILFSCADIGQPIMVTLKVTDAVGLENFCDAEIFVRDFLKPNIQCPASVTLNCLQDYTDLGLTGQATATDNCSLQSLDFLDNSSNLNACNMGVVIRVWKAVDASINVKTCTQTITLQAINSTTVTFPANVLVNDCASPDALLPDATGWPVLGGQACSQLSIDYTDHIFTGTAPYCWRILRDWKVVDHCLYNPNGGTAGIWEYTQIVDIVDNTPPYLELPADITLAANPSDCTVSVVMNDVFSSDCSSQISVSNNSLFANTAGPNASGDYPVGIHNVIFIATDGCGNSTSKVLTVTVQDETPPTAVCLSGVALLLPASGLVTPDPQVFNNGSSDACSPQNSLTFTLSPDTFNCQTIGLQPITLTVNDAAGNSASCSTFVLIKDNNHVCGGGYMVEGTIRTPTGLSLRNIPVQMLAGNVLESLDCDTLGYFAFHDVPAGDTCRIRPTNNANWLNGVTTFDLLLISKHILGIEPLNSPQKMIAADANKSNSITTFDIVQLRKVLLGILDSVPGNTSWRFLDSTFVFANPFNPFSAPFPEEIRLNNLTDNQLGNNFTGLKIGDVNNSTDPTNARSPEDTLFLDLGAASWKVGEVITLPISMPEWNNLEGFQFELEFDSLTVQVEHLEFGNPSMLNEKNAVLRDGNRLLVSWDNVLLGGDAGSPLFTLTLRGLTASDLHSSLKIRRDRLAPEAYKKNHDAISAIDLRGNNASKSASQAFLQLFPNPNNGAFQIQNPLKGSAQRLRVGDSMGNIVWEQSGEMSDLITLSLKGLLPGIYWVELTGNDTCLTGKLVVD